jgi:RNA polymerase sigma-32 factor
MGRPHEEDAGFSAYLASIQKYEPLDRDEELRLARRWLRRKDREAADMLVRANLRFVVKIAMQYRGYGLRVSDLVEEGNIGLCEAVRRFDPSRGLRFMTYAAYWIRAYVLAHVLKQWSMVGVGTGPLQSKLFFRMARERARITTALGAESTPSAVEERLAAKFGTSVERIRDMTGRLEAKDSSLDQAAYKDGNETQLDRLADEHGEGQEESFERMQRDSIVRARVSGISRTLSSRERYILARRLLCDEQDTLAEIGRHLNLSRERVRQIEDRLKLKLRRALPEFEPQPLRA